MGLSASLTRCSVTGRRRTQPHRRQRSRPPLLVLQLQLHRADRPSPVVVVPVVRAPNSTSVEERRDSTVAHSGQFSSIAIDGTGMSRCWIALGATHPSISVSSLSLSVRPCVCVSDPDLRRQTGSPRGLPFPSAFFLGRTAAISPGRTDHTTDTQGSAAQLKTEGRKTTTSDRGRVMGRDEMRHGCRACDPRTERRSNAALPTASSNLRWPAALDPRNRDSDACAHMSRMISGASGGWARLDRRCDGSTELQRGPQRRRDGAELGRRMIGRVRGRPQRRPQQSSACEEEELDELLTDPQTLALTSIQPLPVSHHARPSPSPSPWSLP